MKLAHNVTAATAAAAAAARARVKYGSGYRLGRIEAATQTIALYGPKRDSAVAHKLRHPRCWLFLWLAAVLWRDEEAGAGG